MLHDFYYLIYNLFFFNKYYIFSTFFIFEKNKLLQIKIFFAIE